MKKVFLFAVPVLFVLFFLSCGKGNKSTVHDIHKVKSYSENFTSSSENLSSVFNINYDANDRIISVVSMSRPGDKFLFNYDSEDHYTMDLYNGGSINIHEEFFLKNSRIDSTFQYDDSMDSTSEKYIYNSINQLIKIEEYDVDNGPELSNTTTYTYDADGNVAKASDSNGKIETFDYYPGLLNVMPLTSPYMLFSGKANLVKTDAITSNGSPVATIISTYTFDSYNRISMITQTATDGSSVVKAFTYF